MEPADQIQEHEKKIRHLEQELNDLRQGLAVVTDYYCELKRVPVQQEPVTVEVRQTTENPTADDDTEFDTIWKFHEEVLAADPGSRVPCTAMYDAFVRFCTRSGRAAVEQEAFEFVFAHMENPVPSLDCGQWIGYRLRPEMLGPR
jgi:hypothetical protein